MTKNFLKATLLSLVIFDFITPSAMAACPYKTSVLEGTWNSYSADEALGGWFQCQLIVLSSGSLKTGTNCTDSAGRSAKVSGGALSVNSNTCVVTGSLSLQGGTTAKIQHGTLSLNKTIIHGVGTGGGGARPTFMLLKI